MSGAPDDPWPRPAPPGPVPPPPPSAPQTSGAGCLRLALFAVVLFVAVCAAVGVLIAIFASNGVDRPQLVTRNPPVVGRAPDVGPPPKAVPLSTELQRRVANSIVRVSGAACQEIQQGTGFVARPGYVITNAHVVAGEAATTVVDHAGRRFDATVVHFDPVRDLALLHVPSTAAAGIPPLAITDPQAPQDLAVFGHPGGGTLRIVPARLVPASFVDGVGRDIYGRPAPGTRKLLALAARLAPGDSGGAVVNVDGRVVAMAFAINQSGAPIAYALRASELQSIVSTAVDPVATGRCVSP